MADISFAAGSVGLGIPFVLTSGASSLFSDAGMATVTWLFADGSQRALSLVSALSAEFMYTIVAGEFRVPTRQTGQLRVSVATGTFFSSAFQIAIHPTLQRPSGE